MSVASSCLRYGALATPERVWENSNLTEQQLILISDSFAQTWHFSRSNVAIPNWSLNAYQLSGGGDTPKFNLNFDGSSL